MKRSPLWFHWLLLVCLVLIIGQVGALTWLAPHYIIRAVEYALKGKLSIGGARLSFPLTTTLTHLRLADNTAETAFSLQRVVIKPRGISLASRTLRLGIVEIQRPFWRVTRLKDGTVLWSVHQAKAGQTELKPDAPVEHRASSSPSSWRIVVETIKVVDGVLEFFDERPSMPFHGILDHSSFVMGPITMVLADAALPPSPFTTVASPEIQAAGLSFAGRTQLVGEAGAAASLYCSGWLDIAAKDLQTSCRLEPIALAAFEPYYHGPSQLRVSTAMLSSTSQWGARSNNFTGRIQLELSNFSEGLSIRGRTIIDAKNATAGKEPRLSGEIYVTGPLDNPREWHAEFLPGDDQVQQLIKRLLDHGVEMIKIPFPGGPLHMSIAPASKATMTGMEAASREVEEALDILSTPPVSEPSAQLPLHTAGPPTGSVEAPLVGGSGAASQELSVQETESTAPSAPVVPPMHVTPSPSSEEPPSPTK